MSVIATFLTAPRSFNTVLDPSGRIIERQLKAVPDFDYPSGLGDAASVQKIAKYAGDTVDGGTFTATVGEDTTDDIDFDATGADIAAAINAAADATIVSGSGGDLNTADVVITFLATGPQAPIVLDLGSLTNATDPSTATAVVSETTEGQAGRSAWAILKQLGIVTSAVPAIGDGPSGLTVGSTAGNFPHQLDDETVRSIVTEASLQDGNDNVKTLLLAALKL